MSGGAIISPLDSERCQKAKQSCDASDDGTWKFRESGMVSYWYCEIGDDPPLPPPPTWLEELINNISDCVERTSPDRPTLVESAFCMIQIQAVYFVGLGIIAIGIAGQIFNRRRGYHDY